MGTFHRSQHLSAGLKCNYINSILFKWFKFIPKKYKLDYLLEHLSFTELKAFTDIIYELEGVEKKSQEVKNQEKELNLEESKE